jgi:drug/metabolite transporter (DMT)-like permease
MSRPIFMGVPPGWNYAIPGRISNQMGRIEPMFIDRGNRALYPLHVETIFPLPEFTTLRRLARFVFETSILRIFEMGAWVSFWLVGLVWGSSYLLIRIGVQELTTFQVVFIRTVIAAIGLNAVVLLQGKRLPRDWPTLRALILLGLGNTVAPFLLITWGEKSVESGLAGVLQATVSLFSLIIAHFAFQDERMTLQKVAGIVTGFIGVMILGSRSWQNGQFVPGSLVGQLAIILASLFYASFGAYSKKVIRKDVEPIVVAAGSITTAAVVTGIFAVISPALGGEIPKRLAEISAEPMVAVLLLGVLNTFLAYTMFYSIVKALGASRTSMVAYVIPPVSLVLGVIFLDEKLDWRLILGAALIFAAIGIVNLKLFRRPAPALSEAQ